MRADARLAAAPPGLRVLALGLLARALPAADGEPERPEERFLHTCAAHAPLEGIEACLTAPPPDDRRLVALAADLGLTRLELVAAALARAVEDDPLVGRAIAHLQAPIAGSRPCLGLLAQVLSPLRAGALSPLVELIGGRAVATGVLELGEAELPLPERTLRLPDALGLALAGATPALPGVEILAGPAPSVPESLRFEVRRLAALLQRGVDRVVAVRAGSSAEAQQAAHAIAAALARSPALIDPGALPKGLGPLCRLLGWLPVLRLRLGPGERQDVPRLAGYEGPRLALLGPDGHLENGELLDWTVPLPTAAERTALWQRALDDAALAGGLGRTQLQGSTQIQAVGRRARLAAELAGQPAPGLDAVREAALAEARGGLDVLAQPIVDHVPDGALVLPERLQAELALLTERCRRREDLAAGLGPALRLRHRQGVRALFTGPSGTGKTLAAAWLATRLGLPLYRVDLAAVTSKYIGETEKNLAELLARAEAADVVLLFDEADSLFGKRTEVRDANDRFANSQTNYLLQRIETYGGIVLLTSNSRTRLDPAFTRRIDMVVEFPLPGPKERRGLWRSHLGAAHSLDQTELNRLAASCSLAGGDIRNVVLLAAVLARMAGRPIHFADIREGLAIEYRKLAKALPPELAG